MGQWPPWRSLFALLIVLLNHLCTVVAGLQSAVATNSNMIIGNTGAVGTGPQTANPVNVRT